MYDPLAPDALTNIRLVVNGLERSGTIWTSRLIAQCLDSPSLTRSPTWDRYDGGDPAVWGLERPNTAIRRVHYYVRDYRYGEIPVLLVVRNPLDHIVSHRYAWQHGPTPNLHKHAAWLAPKIARFAKEWMEDERCITYVRYEDLHRRPKMELKRIISAFNFPMPPDEFIQEAIYDNEFSRMDNKLKRKGVLGEGRREMEERTVIHVTNACKDFMEGFDYDRRR